MAVRRLKPQDILKIAGVALRKFTPQGVRMIMIDDSSSKYKNFTSLVYNAPTCDVCGQPEVDVYQDEGIFCLECWNKRTEP
jgi:hypothetical protein